MTAKYVYIATVGDSITRAGVEHLFSVAEESQCDAVISKPRCVDANGGALPVSRWPIDEIIESLVCDSPGCFRRPNNFSLR